MENINRPKSDAEWYFRKDPEEERFYDIFFQLCWKYNIRWTSASDKERAFIEEITRVTYKSSRINGSPPVIMTNTL